MLDFKSVNIKFSLITDKVDLARLAEGGHITLESNILSSSGEVSITEFEKSRFHIKFNGNEFLLQKSRFCYSACYKDLYLKTKIGDTFYFIPHILKIQGSVYHLYNAEFVKITEHLLIGGERRYEYDLNDSYQLHYNLRCSNPIPMA